MKTTILFVLLLCANLSTFSVSYAEPYKVLPNGNVEVSAARFQEDMKDLVKLDELIKLKEIMFEDIKILEATITKHKQIETINDEIINGSNRIITQQRDFEEYQNKFIVSQRNEIQKLESKGTKDMVGKYSNLFVDTLIGCGTGSIFPVVGTVVGCVAGAFSSMTRSFLKN